MNGRKKQWRGTAGTERGSRWRDRDGQTKRRRPAFSVDWMQAADGKALSFSTSNFALENTPRRWFFFFFNNFYILKTCALAESNGKKGTEANRNRFRWIRERKEGVERRRGGRGDGRGRGKERGKNGGRKLRIGEEKTLFLLQFLPFRLLFFLLLLLLAVSVMVVWMQQTEKFVFRFLLFTFPLIFFPWFFILFRKFWLVCYSKKKKRKEK